MSKTERSDETKVDGRENMIGTIIVMILAVTSSAVATQEDINLGHFNVSFDTGMNKSEYLIETQPGALNDNSEYTAYELKMVNKTDKDEWMSITVTELKNGTYLNKSGDYVAEAMWNHYRNDKMLREVTPSIVYIDMNDGGMVEMSHVDEDGTVHWYYDAWYRMIKRPNTSIEIRTVDIPKKTVERIFRTLRVSAIE